MHQGQNCFINLVADIIFRAISPGHFPTATTATNNFAKAKLRTHSEIRISKSSEALQMQETGYAAQIRISSAREVLHSQGRRQGRLGRTSGPIYEQEIILYILNSAGEKELGHSLGSRSLYCRKAHSRPRATRDLAETMNHRPPWTGHGPWAMM